MGLIVGDKTPTPMDGIISSLIVKALVPLNFVGNKLGSIVGEIVTGKSLLILLLFL